MTLVNPFGPPVRGWPAVSDRLDLAASHFQDGEETGFENFSTVVGEDIAYMERHRVLRDVRQADGDDVAFLEPPAGKPPPAAVTASASCA